MKKLATLAVALALGACTATGTTPASNIDKALEIARTSLQVAKIGAGVYQGLAPCSDTVKPPLCRSDAVAAQITTALAAANVAIEAAASVYSTANSSQADRDKAIEAATTAVAAVLNILGRYGLAS
jgi:pyrimidine deaminase RibD-like protein